MLDIAVRSLALCTLGARHPATIGARPRRQRVCRGRGRHDRAAARPSDTQRADGGQLYTCGYWPEGTPTLEQAQRNKIDHVCRKLRLAKGERFVDLGCGFGGFMFRALETTGALGTGINTATEQVKSLGAEIARRGLQGQLAVREADFREVDGPYDKLVSIGVLEHAGRDQLAEVIRAHADFLKPGGLGILHFIGHVGRHDTELVIRKHVFPGGWIPSLADVIVEDARRAC